MMNREERIERLAQKQAKWTVWDIKNRWLRALVTWLLAAVTALFVAGVCIVGVAWFALVGAVSRPVQELRWLDHREWREILSNFWLAGTGRDAPGKDSP